MMIVQNGRARERKLARVVIVIQRRRPLDSPSQAGARLCKWGTNLKIHGTFTTQKNRRERRPVAESWPRPGQVS